MDKTKALDILIAEAICGHIRFKCEDCPLYVEGEQDCKYINDEIIEEAIMVLKKAKGGKE